MKSIVAVERTGLGAHESAGARDGSGYRVDTRRLAAHARANVPPPRIPSRRRQPGLRRAQHPERAVPFPVGLPRRGGYANRNASTVATPSPPSKTR